MRDFRDAKAMAQSLRQALSDRSVTVTHSDCLELVSKAFGLDNWNILAAKIEAAKPAPAEPAGKTLYCSFCGKSQHDVERLIAGPNVHICDGCVGLCDSILVDQRLAKTLSDARSGASPLEAAAEALSSASDAQIEQSRKGCADWLEHIEWSIKQTDAALESGPGEAWSPDEVALKRGWTRNPFAGKSRADVKAHRDQLAERKSEVSERLRLLTQLLADRASPAGA
jgi:hypothetical protein